MAGWEGGEMGGVEEVDGFLRFMPLPLPPLRPLRLGGLSAAKEGGSGSSVRLHLQ
jgi:hypothetical protein